MPIRLPVPHIPKTSTFTAKTLQPRIYQPILKATMTDRSHAVGGSVVPDKAQEKLPQGIEENVPNKVHDTGSSGAQSHATGDSKVPKVLQEAVPKGMEEALPNKIHDTSPGGVATK